jgi:hypothetical protein
MFIIDIALKNTPSMLSVQRKVAEDAEATYQQVVNAIRLGDPVILELTCEKEPGKKFSILVSEISAVQMSDRSGTSASSGRPPGFFVMAGE